MNYYLIAASHRPDSLNRRLLLEVKRQVSGAGHVAELDEYAALDLPVYNDHAFSSNTLPPALSRLIEKLAANDGLIIATPEYNWSYPGSLKTIIDWLSRVKPNPLDDKMALLLSASTSARGGILGLTHLKTSLEALDMFVFPRMFALGHAASAFADNGQLAEGKKAAQLADLVTRFCKASRQLKD